MDDRERAIRQRAHEIWLAQGEPEGRDAEHWEQAERELAAGGGNGETVDAAMPQAVSNETADAKLRKKSGRTPKGT